MLILTRRVGETILIGDEVKITVLRVKGNQVRIGVDAPRSVSVQREEIITGKQGTHPDADADNDSDDHLVEASGSQRR